MESNASASESFFKGLTEALPQLIWTALPDGSINFINKRCMEFTGATEKDNPTEHWYKALHPDDSESAGEKWRHSLKTGEIFQHEYRLKRFDGVYHWFLGRSVPIKNSEGQIIYWLGTATDIESQKRLVEALKLSRDELNIILEGVTEGITVLDHEGKFIYANKMGAQLCGFDTPEEFLKNSSAEIMERFQVMDEEGAPLEISRLPSWRALSGETSIPQMVVKFKDRKTKEVRWALVGATPVFDTDNQVKFAVSIFRDFTVYKQNEAAIRDKEREFRLLAETIPHMAWTARPDGTCDWFNQRWIDYTGIDLPTGLNLLWTVVLEGKDRISAEKEWAESLRTERPFEIEYKIKSEKSGEYRWHLVRALPARDEEGEIIKWFGTCTDIHEAKMAQENVMKAEESSRFLAEAGIILGATLDSGNTLEKLLELITPRLADWCQVDLIDPVGTLPRSLIRHSDPNKVVWAQKLKERFPTDWSQARGSANVIRTGESELYEYISDDLLRSVSQSDEHYEIIKSLGMKSAIIVPIIGKRKILGSLTLISSDTDRTYNQMDLTIAKDIGRRTGVAIGKALLYESEREARKEAEDANKAKSTFLANMSHEMRTPLNALIGFNDLLKESNLTHDQRISYHEIISRNGELLLRLIDDILDLSKVEAGHLTLEQIPVSLPDLVSEVTAVLNAKAIKKGLRFTIELDSSVPETIVTDPTRLKQILNNIIGNAIKFTSEGGVSLEVESDRISQKVRFRVTDTGVGIRPEHRKNLFQPFSQADPSVTRRFGGTGLGLVLSRKLAQSLGGDLIIAEFEEGKGASFLIEVSGNLLPEARIIKAQKESSELQGANLGDGLKGRRILLVEDSPDNQLLVECVLRAKGMQVEMAENGQIGMNMALSGDFDLVLMDVQMPIMDGYTAMKLLKKKKYSKPIVALTAHAMKEDRERCLESGCVDYLTKPIKPAALVQTIAKHLL